MHIKLLYRKVLYVFLSVMIVFANTQTAYAASPAGWTVQSAVTYGSSTVINAIKNTSSGALASTVEYIAPAGNVAKEIVKIGGGIAVAYALSQLLGAGVDWVLDPANNTVKYKTALPHDGTNEFSFKAGDFTGASASAVANQYCQFIGRGSFVSFTRPPNYTENLNIDNMAGIFDIRCTQGLYGSIQSFDTGIPSGVKYEDKTMPISTVAAKVIANAEAGHAPSQALIKTVAIADANKGVVDARLDDAAVPYDPANPNDPNNPAIPFDPSSILAAIASLKSIVDNGFSTMRAKMETFATELGLIDAKIDTLSADVADTKRVINDGMADVVAANNATGAKVGDVVAAIEALEGNMLTGEVINAAIDRAIAAGHTDTASIVAAIQGIEGNTLDGQVINDAIDRVIANDNVNAQSAADAAEAAKAADVANTAAVTDAIVAQTDAMTTTDPATGEKSLKLPAFCGFAPVVCEYITWVKGEYGSVMEWVKAEPEVKPDDPVVVADDPSGLGNIFQDKAEAGYVSFESSCPADVLIPIDLMGASQVLNISYTPFCHFASMIRYAVILGAWISGLLIVTGGRSRE